MRPGRAEGHEACRSPGARAHRKFWTRENDLASLLSVPGKAAGGTVVNRLKGRLSPPCGAHTAGQVQRQATPPPPGEAAAALEAGADGGDVGHTKVVSGIGAWLSIFFLTRFPKQEATSEAVIPVCPVTCPMATNHWALRFLLQPVAAQSTDSVTRESQALGSASVRPGGQAASATLSQVCWGSGQPQAVLGYRGP